MIKTFTRIIASKIYKNIENNIINEEQKGCSRNSMGTKDQLLLKIATASYKKDKCL